MSRICSAEDEGGLRIIPGFADNQGRLEINYRGEWGTVCDKNFENVDAEVACKQLGYCSGIMHPPRIINNGNDVIWLNHVQCSGSESKLLNCSYNNDIEHCSHHDDVGIHCFLSCSAEDEGDLRINSGFAVNQGRLEIKYKGEWGTVCENDFENIDAKVACRQLGYCSGIMHPANIISNGNNAIWLRDVMCSGSESKLLNCTYNIETSYCSHHDDVGIHCFLSCSAEDEGELRISAGFAVNQGRLEINYKGEWGTVCDKNFENVDAEVACRQLGYCSGIMHPADIISNGNGAIWLNDVQCSGSESLLLNCSYNNDLSLCSHYKDVGVHCFLSCSAEDGDDLRIVDGFAVNQGRLEINYRGEWGTVCNKNFEDVDAEVACRQLGYCSGIMQPIDLITDGRDAIWLTEVKCSGSENKLLNCKFNTDTLQCSHYHDVGIHCFLSCSAKDQGSLRITDGFAENQGRLEVTYKGEWGTVCDRYFDDVDAEVACKQLGYCSGIMHPADLIRDGQGAIWLNEVKCSGSESKLLNCIYNKDTTRCSHYHDVGIHCFLNCSKEDEGVTPNEKVIHPTIGVAVVIIGVVVVLIGAVVTLLVCWFRRRSSQLRTGRPTAEPEHRSTPETERSFDELNNRSPPRNRRPFEEPDNRVAIVSDIDNDHYDRPNYEELTSSLFRSNSDYLEPIQGESTFSANPSHAYCELRNGSGNSSVVE
ncbi:unnamed protein product [Mytilus coruscus]|uniref:SRCR domain-containing protein n=1 Tax=Mytilus coruscus TaxID=42192 RepID=A0A6J8EVB9_MYTCO|nr:unnamed protein product [Mytilus coruscus]